MDTVMDIKCIKYSPSSSRAVESRSQDLVAEATVPEPCIQELMSILTSHLSAGSKHLADLIQKVRSGNTHVRSLLTLVRSVSTL